jgi:hypothetical protein
MITSDHVEIILTNRNYNKLIKKYRLKNDLKVGDIAKIPLNVLSKSSHYEIEIKCDYCLRKLKVPYKRYNLNTKIVNKYACSDKECSNQKIKDVCQAKYGVDNPFQADFVKLKMKETLVEKYGVEHPMFMKETKDKINETCIERYGVTNYAKTQEFKDRIIKTNLEKYGVEYELKTKEGQLRRKKTRIEKGYQIPDNLVSDYRKYRLQINRELQRMKKYLLESWDGFDYYDGEYIKDNFNLEPKNRCYPHFDHKISVIYGFKNNIDYESISNKSNICITKQWINGMKKDLNENEFKKIFEDYKKNQS